MTGSDGLPPDGGTPPSPDPANNVLQPTRTEGEGETLDMPEGMQGFTTGQVLGERYQILEMLGRGGMGEVWHAFDLKLRVEVALKALRSKFFKSERRLELLRQEVRAAREVMSPNVCRIFDLIEVEGRELVSMEYVDGATLLGVLQERGPLELKEAQDIASQFLAGLEAIHKVGLIHRDIKPENIMLTRAGRVVVMDFGLARQETEGGGTVAGTPAYMSPEQAAGQTLDARADVYAAGVVLAEMVSPEGIKSFDSRQSVWAGVRSEPAKLPDTPWAPVIQQAVKKDRDGRFNTAHTLTRALEDVTLRVEGADDLHPYPGLASFAKDDAEYFFGREAEVEQMWRRLDGPARLLGLVGPSGAGKSSFLHAGLTPGATSQWSTIVCKPGNNPELSLSRAIGTEMSGDTEAVDLLLQFNDPEVALEVVSRWRRRTGNAALIVDQFEELFTQNSRDVQDRFGSLLIRLVLEADVHVLLSMREDFLFRCHAVTSLDSVFHEITPIGPPVGGALRRALIQPAQKCGYRFEDDELVDEMLADVEGERGALPLLAFAAARLWDRRDRDTGLLTREAYQEIGGVGGALTQHAEATIDRIGVERIPVVRELMRNLVTAEGTRATREWDELLSVFGDSQQDSAEEVLRELIDARLLTSYEIQEEDEKPTRNVEIIHESLIANWPRLVRWQTQDQEGAQLRDELRQAARTWEEHGRHDDRLWAGTTIREYQLWRERYPGGLTDIEEAFGNASTVFAGRRRRRRRLMVAAGFAVLIAGLAIVGSFWQRSVQETSRAEAQKLVALGQLEIEGSPSAAVAHATASLELSDTPESRRLAVEALWKGPTGLVVTEDIAGIPVFSGDGRWLVHSVPGPPSEVRIIRADGRAKTLERAHEANRIIPNVSPGSDFLLTYSQREQAQPPHMVLWSAPAGRRLAEVRYDGASFLKDLSWNRERVLVLVLEGEKGSVDAVRFDGTRERLGTLGIDFPPDEDGDRRVPTAMDRQTGRWLGAVVDNEVLVFEIGEHGLSETRHLGRQEGSRISLVFDPFGRYLATANHEGELRLWDPTGVSSPTILEGQPGIWNLSVFGDGTLVTADIFEDEHRKVWMWSVTDGEPRLLRRFDLGKQSPGMQWGLDSATGHLARVDWDRQIHIWPFSAPAEAEPLIVGRDEPGELSLPVFDQQGRWLATSSESGLTFWPLGRPYSSVMHHDVNPVGPVVFGPNGTWLASCGGFEAVRIWPLDDGVAAAGRTVDEANGIVYWIAASPASEHLLVSVSKRLSKRLGKGWIDGDLLVSLRDGSLRVLTGFKGLTLAMAFSPDGRLAAGIGGLFDETENVIRVWDVVSGEELTVLEPEEDLNDHALQFTGENHLLTASTSGLRQWNVETGESELLYEGAVQSFSASADGRRVLLITVEDSGSNYEVGRATVLDLETGVGTTLVNHGTSVMSVAIDSTGTIAATGDPNGTIRVGTASGEEPHLLLGHEAEIYSLAFDPLGRWIASGANDGTARLWPMPDLSEPPLHTLPRVELIAKLKTLTNLRVVRDEESSTGWNLTHDPFPGWETVPTW